MEKRINRRAALVPVLLFVLAICLLVFSTIGGASAALTFYSQSYTAEFGMLSVGVGLAENGKAVGEAGLLTTMLKEGEELQLGKSYEESITAVNTGTIDEYLRLVIYKYWEDEEGKVTSLSPELIRLDLAGSGWIEDRSNSTAERTVYYYAAPVAPGGAAAALSGTLSIDPEIGTYVKQTINGNTVTTTYVYDGVRFCIEVEADAIQSHNAEDAILSAWGRRVNVSDTGMLSLAGGR